jgi:hypothetical protein
MPSLDEVIITADLASAERSHSLFEMPRPVGVS